MQTLASQALTQFKGIISFSVAQNPQNTVGARDSLINQVRDSYDTFYASATPHIAYSVRKGTDFEGLERDARKALDEIRASQAQQLQLQKTASDEAQRIVETMRRAAGDVGVAQHAMYFKLEAEHHSEQGKAWLVGTIVLSTITLLLIAGLIFWYVFSPGVFLSLTPSQAVQVGIAKLALLSLLYFGIVFCSRNYRAHQHNLTVNRHRQNALSTFETFVKAAAESQTKDGVLLYAAQSIFAPQNTGYSGKDSEPPTAPQVLEIIRGAMTRPPSS